MILIELLETVTCTHHLLYILMNKNKTVYNLCTCFLILQLINNNELFETKDTYSYIKYQAMKAYMYICKQSLQILITWITEYMHSRACGIPMLYKE